MSAVDWALNEWVWGTALRLYDYVCGMAAMAWDGVSVCNGHFSY